MTDGVLTASEIAKLLNLPASTIRYYRDKFAGYIPTMGEGRTRRYPPEAVDVFRFIADRIRKGQTAEDVAHQLSLEFARHVDVQPQPQAITTTKQQPLSAPDLLMMAAMFSQAMEQVAAAMNRISDQQEAIDHLKEQVAQQQDVTTELQVAAEQQGVNQKQLSSDLREILDGQDKRIDEKVAQMRQAMEQQRAEWDEEQKRKTFWQRMLGR